jgi:ABC-2 type transport system permease protein
MSATMAPAVTQGRAFRAVLGRDLFVTWSEFPVFLAQVILQPLFLLLVFGKVLGALGYTRNGYAHLLFPGLLALTAVITGMQTLAFPLVVEFGWTKEIEDRLLAPMAAGRSSSRRCCSPAAANIRGPRWRTFAGSRSSPRQTR